jgi:hypothetical protein
MEYETVLLQELLREIAGRTAIEQDADAIRLAAETLDDIASGDRWIPATDRTPAPHEVVLYFANEPHRFTGIQVGHLYDGTWQGRWLYPSSGVGEIKPDGPCFHERFVTHWMPLPEPPEGE